MRNRSRANKPDIARTARRCKGRLVTNSVVTEVIETAREVGLSIQGFVNQTLSKSIREDRAVSSSDVAREARNVGSSVAAAFAAIPALLSAALTANKQCTVRAKLDTLEHRTHNHVPSVPRPERGEQTNC